MNRDQKTAAGVLLLYIVAAIRVFGESDVSMAKWKSPLVAK